MMKFILILVLPFFLVSCKEERPPHEYGKLNRFERADALLGKWTGPEGTFLQIDKAEGNTYKVTVQNLDGPREFAAKASDKGVVFKRDGAEETIVAGDGIDTGMKWLSDKIDCVLIKEGEGFCRD